MADSIYPYTPFVYLIGWSKLNKWYYGCRYSILTNAHPSDLWVSYFTSSKHVEKFVKENGDPDVIMIRKTFTDAESAYLYESKILRRLNVKGRDDFLNESNGCGDNFSSNAGKRRIRNHIDPSKATKERCIQPEESVPEGWYYGKIGKKFIRNHPNMRKATEHKKINSNEPIPEGWYIGSLPPSSKKKEKMKYIRNHQDPKKATKQKWIKSNDPVPEGWCYGKIGMKWIRNHPDVRKATEQKKINYCEPVPEGWYLGSMSHSTKSKENMKLGHSKGSWITPYGVFSSAKDAAENSYYKITDVTIEKWCKSKNNKVISKQSILKSCYLQQTFNYEDIIGKTYKEIGFSFEHCS